jgi:hypothetical protein
LGKSSRHTVISSLVFAALLLLPGLAQDLHRVLDHWHDEPLCLSETGESHLHDTPLDQEVCFLCALPSLSALEEAGEGAFASPLPVPGRPASGYAWLSPRPGFFSFLGRAPPLPLA